MVTIQYLESAIAITYICFDQIVTVRNKVVVIFHIAALLDAHKVLHRVEVLALAGAREELLDGHALAQVHRGEGVLRQRDLVGLFRVVPVAHLHRAPARATVRAGQDRRTALGGAATGQQVVQQRRRSRTDERVERGHREDAQLVQRVLGGARHVRQERLLDGEGFRLDHILGLGVALP